MDCQQSNRTTSRYSKGTFQSELKMKSSTQKKGIVYAIHDMLLFKGQRCSGRNYNGRRCCTPEQPCGLVEGDCDGPLDGGGSDGHRGCQGSLVCGSNNCKKFGLYYHEKDDCCDVPSSLNNDRPAPVFIPGVPIEPPQGKEIENKNKNFVANHVF